MQKIILVGAPNSGKTTLYNWITGSKFKTVNYPGSTVDFVKGTSLKDYGQQFEVLDTPGVRSLDPHSPDEEVTMKCLYDETKWTEAFVVVPVDATQLERHLFLVKRLLKAKFPVIVTLTMLDLLKEKGLEVDVKGLAEKLGVPVFVTDGRLGGGVKELVQGLDRKTLMNLSPLALAPQSAQEIEAIYSELENIVNQVVRPLVSPFGQVESNNTRQEIIRAHERTLKIDKYLMHPVLGLVFFVLIMAGLFTSVFWLAQPLMDFIDETFGAFASWTSEALPGTLIADFVGNGLVGGVGSVIVFLPQIVILFLILGLLEDSGYLARAASLVDKPLTAIGLNGRSFIPLLSGYACAIPAMMAARTITNKKERLLTLFIIPLMSCSARLPVFALLLGLLFPDQALLAGLSLTAIYFGSLLMGAIAASVASRFIKNNEKSWFMLELPVYRQPHFKFVLKTVGLRTSSYLKKAGLPIIVISLSIWALSTFPNYNASDDIEKLNSSYLAQAGQFLEPIMQPMGGDWRMGVGILAAFAAREVFVSTLAIIYRISEQDESLAEASLLSHLSVATSADGTLLYTTSTVIGLILYFMIALQCLPTVAVSRVESGSRKFAMVQLVVFTLAAYILAVLTVQGLRALGIT